MIDFQVTFDKLSNFESAQEIREYFNSIGVKGYTCMSTRCPIAVFFKQETEQTVVVEPEFIARDGLSMRTMNTKAMTDFVHNFDDWLYPELIHPEERFPELGE